MSQDDSRVPATAPPARVASLLYLASVLALAGVLGAMFLSAYTLLRDHPGHVSEVLPQLYGALAVGLPLLAGQAALVFLALVRPYREAAIRIETLAHALDQHSHRDALTGALNRTAFDQMVVRELDALRRYGVGFCGIMLDVDGFRLVNERQGYEAGDQLLFDLALLLKKHMRKADFVFRWRSGRFLILASGISAAQGRTLAGKLKELVAGHHFSHGISVTASLGVAQARAEDSPEHFVARVKAALAQAKEQGPGGLAVTMPAE